MSGAPGGIQGISVGILGTSTSEIEASIVNPTFPMLHTESTLGGVRRLRRSRLTVIKGEGRPGRRLLEFPAKIAARSPFDKSATVQFRVSRADATKATLAHNHQPAYLFWCGVMGRPPEIPSAFREGAVPRSGLTKLLDAHACFQGLKRPYAGDDHGEHHLIYLLKPEFYYKHVVEIGVSARLVTVEEEKIFHVHVRLDSPYDPSKADGMVTHWQFFETDPDNKVLPVDWEGRYDKRHW